MSAKGVELYCALTVDDRLSWAATMTRIALEGGTHVLSACQFITKAACPGRPSARIRPALRQPRHPRQQHDRRPDRGVSCRSVVDEETILFLYANIGPGAETLSHLDPDVVGRYARTDIFGLRVDTIPRSLVSFTTKPAR